MNVLPIEILTRISSYLSYSDRKCFSLVCKRFNISIYFKELWQDIIYVIDKSSINQINVNFLNVLTSIKLFSVNIYPEQLHEIIKYSSNLSELALVICLDLFTDNDRFKHIFINNISCDVIRILSRLKSLCLSGNRDQLSDICLNCLLFHCRHLQQIDLSELSIVNLNDCLSSTKRVTLRDEINQDYYEAFVVEPFKLTFGNIICQLWVLRHTLTDISFSGTDIELVEVDIIVKIPQLRLAGVCLDHCKSIDYRSVQTLLKHQSSTLRRVSLLNTLAMPLSLLESILSSMPQLNMLKLKGLPIDEKLSLTITQLHLTSLHLENCVVNDRLIEIINLAKSLTELSLLGCNFKNVRVGRVSLTNLLKVNLSRSYGLTWTPLLTSIFTKTTILDLRIDAVKIDDPDFDISLLTELTVLSLVGCSRLTGSTVAKSLCAIHRLQVLRLQAVTLMDDTFLESIWHMGVGLRELDLSGAIVSDNCLLRYLTRSHKLRRLRLDNCNNITKKFVVALPRLCPYLQDVSMRNCDLIENPIVLNYYDHMFLYQLQTTSA